MRFLWISAKKDLLRRLADPMALAIWLGIPVLIGGLMSLVAGGGDVKPKAKILLADQDDTFLSDLLANAGDDGMGDMIEIEVVDLEEGEERMDDGEATALIVLPEGFAQGVVDETPVELRLVTNPAQRILPKIVEESLEVLVEAAFYLQRVFGEQLRIFAEGPPDGGSFFTDARMAEISADINARMRGLDRVLFPPVLEVKNEVETEDEEGGFNFGTVLLPGFLFMSLLFIAQGMSEDLWKEKRLGTLRRSVSLPQPFALFLGGKLLCGSLLMGAVAFVGLVAAALLFDVEPRLFPLALVWCAFAGTVLLAYFFLLHAIAKTQRAGNVLTMLILFPLMMIGGSFFPFENMPDWMARLGKLTPNGLALVRLRELFAGELHLAGLSTTALGIGLPACLAFALTLARLRGRFATG